VRVSGAFRARAVIRYMIIDCPSEPEPTGSSGVRHLLGNFSLQLLVSKGGRRFLLTKWGDEAFILIA